MLSESQAWEKIAREFYEIYQTFICNAIASQRIPSNISVKLENKMISKVLEDVKLFNVAYGKARNHFIFEREDSWGERPDGWYLLRGDYCLLQKYIVDSGGI